MRAGEWVIVSGQIGITAQGLAPGGLEAELAQALENLGRALDSQGLRRDQVAKTTVFLTDMADYARFNEVYVAWFGDHRPARSCVAVAALPLGACVEVEAWVHDPA